MPKEFTGLYMTTEIKGDVKFSEDNKGNLYYLLPEDLMWNKVKDGSIAYRNISTANGYQIKFNTNGIYGYSIWKGSNCLEDGFWELDKATDAAKTM